jgi:HEAT repeat protein
MCIFLFVSIIGLLTLRTTSLLKLFRTASLTEDIDKLSVSLKDRSYPEYNFEKFPDFEETILKRQGQDNHYPLSAVASGYETTKEYWERLENRLGIKLHPRIIGYRYYFKGDEALNLFKKMRDNQIAKVEEDYFLCFKEDVYPIGEEVDILIDIYRRYPPKQFKDVKASDFGSIAAILLSKSRDKKAIQFLNHVLQTSLSSQERQWAARSLASLHMLPLLSQADADYLHQVALYDKDKKVRLAALCNLLKHDNPRYMQLRKNLIHSSDTDIKKIAVRSMKLDIYDERVLLLEIAKHDPNYEIREESIYHFLGDEREGNPDCLVLALDILKDEQAEKIRKDIIVCIRHIYLDRIKCIMFDYPETYKKFKSILKSISEADKSEGVRKEAKILLMFVESVEKAELENTIR